MMISRLCSSAAIGSGFLPGPRSRPSAASCRGCEADADALVGGTDLHGDRRHGFTPIDRWALRARAGAVGAGSALRPSLLVSQSARRPAEGAGVGSIGVLDPVRAA